jgi:hypothetical protein
VSTKSSRPPVLAKVRPYFTERPDVEVRVDDIVQETGLTRQQVLNAISAMRHAKTPIDIAVSGHIYVYRSAGLPNKRPDTPNGDLHLMKMVGTLQGGESLFQDTETGHLWKGTRL